ncbi:MAG TPA: hypothetical protein VIN36_00720 [Thiobacillus sp.]
MTDELDIAAERAEIERAAALSQHAARVRSPIPLCEECGEHRVHVTANGVRWRFCVDCAEDFLRRNQTA